MNILPSGMTQKILRLDQIMVGIMHTLFLNLGKHLLLMVKSVLSRKWSNFYEETNTLLIDIQSLSLSWCKCYCYGSNELPGSLWVSDNYLGFSLVTKHLFSILSTHNDEGMQSIMNCVWLYNSLVSVVMQSTECNTYQCDKAESLAKIFLSHFNEMDNYIARKNSNVTSNECSHRSKRIRKDVNKIESTACILNVLSVVNDMRTKGLPQNYWEGGLSGKGIVCNVKPFLKRGLGQLGVYQTTLNKLYNCREINSMIDNQEEEFDIESGGASPVFNK